MDALEIAWWELRHGQKVTVSLPHLAAEALAEGYDSQTLRELAALGVRDDLLARRLLPLVLAELGRDHDQTEDGWGRAVPWEQARERFEAGLVDRTERALAAVQRDLAEVADTVGRLTLHWPGSCDDDGEPHLLVGFDGEPFLGGGNPAEPLWGTDLVQRVLSVAGNTQEAVIEMFQCYWPTCSTHRRGLHLPETYEGGEAVAAGLGWPVWRCRAEGGHRVAPVGDLGAAATPAP